MRFLEKSLTDTNKQTHTDTPESDEHGKTSV